MFTFEADVDSVSLGASKVTVVSSKILFKHLPEKDMSRS
jgi:hypothetical protein